MQSIFLVSNEVPLELKIDTFDWLKKFTWYSKYNISLKIKWTASVADLILDKYLSNIFSWWKIKLTNLVKPG